MIEKLQKLLARYLQQKQFVFRFQVFTDADQYINDEGVVEYQFYNLGTTTIDINGLIIVPNILFGPPTQTIGTSGFRLPINENEMDVTIYTLKFIDTTGGAIPVDNRLLVISKCKASVRTSKP